jgi:hypothetical protein
MATHSNFWLLIAEDITDLRAEFEGGVLLASVGI